MPVSERREFNRAREAVAVNIRALRKAKGWSQEKLADEAGIDRTYVGMLERKLGNPSLRVLSAIAAALGSSTQELM